MNQGKICISLCAETADELIEQIKRAAKLADMIEIRFDCLETSEIDKSLLHIKNFVQEPGKLFLATFRQPEQGGRKKLLTNHHIDFWAKSSLDDVLQWADFEFDLDVDRFNLNFQKTVRSFHLFNRTLLDHSPFFLDDFYTKLSSEYSDSILKVAVQTSDITDSISVWKLLEQAKSDNSKVIPIAMGESGKWTRVLGLAHGALMTYAALDTGGETAPGQISARDLIDVYRVKELDEKTAVYGILGSNTSVSMSPYIHNAAFRFHNLNSIFVPLQTQNLVEFMCRMVKPETREINLNFRGFSVTLPHKQAIIKHLDYLDETAQIIGAVNTVKIVDGKLHGYNTDTQGFIEPLLNSYGDLSTARVAVIGAGGAARACVYALKNAGAEVTIFARDSSKAENIAAEFKANGKRLKNQNENYGDFDILVNATPLGMRGKAEDETPVVAEQMRGLNLVYDLVYIPFQTKLMSEADRAGVPKIGGLAMLIAQGAEQQKIWTNLEAPMKEMARAALDRLK